MAKSAPASRGLTETQRAGTLMAGIAFFITMALYYLFLQPYVPPQLDFVAPIGLACIVYFAGTYTVEYIALRKNRGDVERKNKFRQDLLAVAWFFAGLCLVGAINIAAIYLDIALNSFVNLVLVLVVLVLAWYLSRR
jgi:hypothetical protein